MPVSQLLPLRIVGQLLDPTNGLALSGFRVEARRGEPGADVVVGTSQPIDGCRRFSIDIPGVELSELLQPGRCGVWFRVLTGDEVSGFTAVANTLKAPRWTPSLAGSLTTLVLDGGTAADVRFGEEHVRTLSGRVAYEDGKPLGSRHVYVIGQHATSDELLGVDRTDDDGAYKVRYRAPLALPGESAGVAIEVQVKEPAGSLVIASGPIVNAPPAMVVDLVVRGAKPGPRPDDFSTLVATLKKFAGAAPLRDLSLDRVPLLATQSGESPSAITHVIQAEQFAQTVLDRTESAVSVPAKVFFALLEAGVAHDFDALLMVRDDAKRKALIEKAAANVIVLDEATREQSLTDLRALGAKGLLVNPANSAPTALDRVLQSLVTVAADRQTFTDTWLKRQDDLDGFWTEVATKPPFAATPTLVDAVKKRLTISAFTRHVPEVVEKIESSPSVTALSDMAKLTQAEWVTLLDGIATPPESWLPPDVTGETTAERVAAYAGQLRETAEAAWPTVAVAAGVKRDAPNEPALTKVDTFFTNNAEFEMENQALDAFLEQKGAAAWTGIAEADREATRQKLLGVQRVFRFAPQYTVMKALLDEGIDSSVKLVEAGEEFITENFAQVIGEEATQELLDNGYSQAAMTALLYNTYGPPSRTPTFPVVQNPLPETPVPAHASIPNYTQLFGSQDYCACEHCRSIHGPAAYLVYLVRYLQRATSNGVGHTELRARRADIWRTGLDCDNTDTPLPYIDLVNEVLEDATPPTYRTAETTTAGGANDPRDTETPQPPLGRAIIRNEGTPEELATSPENVWYPAWRTLAKGDRVRYPFSLPFSLPHEEVRLHLAHLGAPRHELMDRFHVRVGSAPVAQHVDVATEHLRILPVERDDLAASLTRPAEDPGRPIVWGVNWVDAGHPEGVLRPADAVGVAWHVYLSRLDPLLRQANVSYEELQMLAGSRYVQLFGTFTVPALQQCSLDGLTINVVAPSTAVGVLDGLQRLFKVRAKLGWPVREAERALSIFVDRMQALPAEQAHLRGAVLDDTLLDLSLIERMRQETRVPHQEILTWWSDLETREIAGAERPLFHKLFLDKGLGTPVVKDFGDLLTTPAGTGKPLRNYDAALVAALGITVADLDALLGAVTDPPVAPTNPTLSLTNVSSLYRHVSLARAARLSVKELVTLLEFTGRSPFFTPSAPDDTLSPPARTRAFLDMVKLVRESGFAVRDIAWLLTPSGYDSSLAPATGAVSQFTTQLQAALKAVFDETMHEAAPPPDGTPVNVALRTRIEARYGTPAANSLDEGFDLTSTLDASSNDDLKNTIRALLRRFMVESQVTAVFGMPGSTEAERDERRRRALDAFVQMETVPEDTERARLREALGQMLEASQVDHVMARFLGERTDTPDAGFEAMLAPFGFFAGGVTVSDYCDPATAQDAPTRGTIFATRCRRALGVALRYLRRQKSVALIEERLAAWLQLDRKAVEVLLDRMLDPGSVALVRDVLLDPAFVQQLPSLAPAPRVLRSLLAAWKASALFRRFNLRASDAAAYLDGAVVAQGDPRWLHANDLPAPDSPAVPPAEAAEARRLRFGAFVRTAALFALQRDLPKSDASVFDLLLCASQAHQALTPPPGLVSVLRDTFVTPLVAATGWRAADIEALLGVVGAAGAETLDPAAAKVPLAATTSGNVGALQRLADCVRTLARLGTDARIAMAWAAPPAGDDPFGRMLDRAAEVRRFVRSKYGEASWREATRPVIDGLRERKRDALVAFQLTHKAYADTNRLFDYHLLDVEMCPCMLTSRVRQAIGAVQLFTQRCMMGLERHAGARIEITETEKRKWAWMQRYRVWEANRKVFLYPENWIEPDLRDDKSPFFRELEQELLQEDVNDRTVEAAVRRYLEKLREVARLQVLTFYEQQGDRNRESLLHVIGRTPTAPHAYYYRYREGFSRWMPWEKIDADIHGEQLAATVVHGRLRLYWLESEEVSDAPSTPIREDRAGGAPAPTKALKFDLCWVERLHDGWSTKRSQAEVFRTGVFGGWTYTSLNTKNYFLQADEDGGLWIWGVNPQIRSANRNVLAYISLEHLIPEGCDGRFRIVPEADRHAYLHIANELTPNGQLLSASAPTRLNMAKYRSDFYDARTMAVAAPPILHGEGRFSLVRSGDDPRVAGDGVFFYQDEIATFFVEPVFKVPETTREPGSAAPAAPPRRKQLLACTKARKAKAPPPADKNPTTLDVQAPDSKEPGGGAKRLTVRGDSGETATGITFVEEEAQSGTMGLGSGSTEAEEDSTEFTVLESVLRFTTFHHPFVCRFMESLHAGGLGALYELRQQFVAPQGPIASFNVIGGRYAPSGEMVDLDSPPRYDIEFDIDSPNALYNWELFFHLPFLVARQLHRNQRFDEARVWYHRIFDPTAGAMRDPDPANPGVDITSIARFWKFRPFYEALRDEDPAQRLRVNQLLAFLQANSTDPAVQRLRALVAQQVAVWERNPFNPHAVARLRIRAYQEAIVMRYIDALIEHADGLFRQDTMETTQEATQLYILAADILGPRPRRLPERTAQTRTLDDIGNVDAFGNALAPYENVLGTPRRCGPPVRRDDTMEVVLALPLYFCVPPNAQLLGYWDLLADRLYKLRHCMNIDGVERRLALFEPPLDPGALVRAAAAGADVAGVTSDLVGATSYYRFAAMFQRAMEFAGEVRNLGAAILAALEKRDGEALSLLRTRHERDLLERVRAVRTQQVEEAALAREALERSRALAQERFEWYSTRPKLNEWEAGSLAMSTVAAVYGAIGQVTALAAATAYVFPDVEAGVAGFAASPFLTAKTGGSSVGSSIDAASKAFLAFSSIYQSASGIMATQGGYERRAEEWELQARLATREMDQIDKQIAAAQVREQIARLELANHDAQVRNAREVEEFLREKFTGAELYRWMASELAGVYFQTYRMAFDLAKRAERAFRFERAAPEAQFIRFGHWDNLRKGLLAGERLQFELRRMEHAYLEQNRRDFEITKHISLAMLDPFALLALKQKGVCEFALPESLFDMDYPGHYLRRVKSVSLTIPAVVGPYTGVHATLTLVHNSMRRTPQVGGGSYARASEVAEDARFIDNLAAIQSIVTSSGQADAGVFQLDFRDERYVPFEGAGAISRWRLELDPQHNPFDLQTVSDVVLHMQYTARDGGSALRQQAKAALDSPDYNDDGIRVISVRHEMPDVWHQFKTATVMNRTLALGVLGERVAFAGTGAGFKVRQVWALAVGSGAAEVTSGSLSADSGTPPPSSDSQTFTPAFSGSPFTDADVSITSVRGARFQTQPFTGPHRTMPWTLGLTLASSTTPALDDLVLVLRFQRQ